MPFIHIKSLPFEQPLIDVLAPDFNADEAIETMLAAVASSIARRADSAPSNIFINVRQAKSGMVFVGGVIVRW